MLFTHQSGMKRYIKRSEIDRFGISPEQFEAKLKMTQSDTGRSVIPSPVPTPTETSPGMPVIASANQPATSVQSSPMDLIRKYFPQAQWSNAYRVMMAESGGNLRAVGDQRVIGGIYAPSYGYFQIRALPGRPVPTQLLDPEFNVRYASQLWREQGWYPWTTARKMGLVR